MMRFSLVFAAVVVSSACIGPRFRAPLCPLNQWNLPPNAVGSYRIKVSSTEPTAKKKGEASALRLVITAQAHAYQITSDASPYDIGRSALVSSEKTFPISLKDIGGEAACKIGNQYYLQMRQSDGTFSLLSIAASDAGLSLKPLGFDYEQLSGRGYQIYSLPEISYNGDQVRYSNSVSLNLPRTPIIDNSAFDAQGTETLLGLSYNENMISFFERMDDAELVPFARKPKLNIRVPRGND